MLYLRQTAEGCGTVIIAFQLCPFSTFLDSLGDGEGMDQVKYLSPPPYVRLLGHPGFG